MSNRNNNPEAPTSNPARRAIARQAWRRAFPHVTPEQLIARWAWHRAFPFTDAGEAMATAGPAELAKQREAVRDFYSMSQDDQIAVLFAMASNA